MWSFVTFGAASRLNDDWFRAEAQRSAETVAGFFRANGAPYVCRWNFGHVAGWKAASPQQLTLCVLCGTLRLCVKQIEGAGLSIPNGCYIAQTKAKGR